VKGVILAAGQGTRMRPLTYYRPKPLVPVVDRPMIEHILRGAARAGVNDWLIVIGYLGDMIVEELGDGSRLGVAITYRRQQEPTGTGTAVLLAEQFVAGESFFLSWSDIIVSPHNYRRLVDTWQEERPPMVLAVNEVDDPWAGAAVYVERGRVVKIVEKPKPGTSTTRYNNAGLFVMPPELFDYVRNIKPSVRNERELPDAIQMFLSEGRLVRAVAIEGLWSDVASPAAVIQLNAKMVWEQRPDGLLIDPTASLAPDVRLVPPVYVGPRCRVAAAGVGPNACLVEEVEVGQGAVLSNCMLCRGVRLDPNARVDHAIVHEARTISGALTGTAEQVVVQPA